MPGLGRRERRVIPSVLAALAAAACFAGAAVLQQEAAQATSADDSLRIALLVHLLGRPKWLGGIAMLVCGYGFQAVALAYGPVALVQPVVVTELAIAIPVAMWRRRRHPLARDWIGIASVLGGISGFLVSASPQPGVANPDDATWIACLTPVVAAVSILIVLSVRARGPARSMLLGVAAGCAFGMLAVLTKAVAYQVGRGVSVALTGWQVYVLVASGIGALLVSQSAYQAGPLAYSMPMIGVLEPVLAVLVGDTAFGEEIRLSGGYLAAQIATAAVAIVGIALLASSPTVLSIYEEQSPAAPPGGCHRTGSAPKR